MCTFFPVNLLDTASKTEQVITCESCKIQLPCKNISSHRRTNLHKSNNLLRSEFDNVDIIAAAFRNRIITYRLNPKLDVEYRTPEEFLCLSQNDIMKLINMSLSKHTCIKLNFELFADYILPKSDERQLKSFNTKYEVVSKSTDLFDMFSRTIEIFKHKLSEFEHCQSGWTYLSISHLEININKYSPMRGGTYIKLPPTIEHTKSCINIQNADEYCFLWSVVAALFPSRSNVCRTSSYPHYSSVLNIEGISFPLSPHDIKQFEINNPEISINVYGLDKKCVVTGPLYITKNKRKYHINLLYIERNMNGHYCLIKDLVRLVRHQVTRYKGKLFYCDTCLQFFNSDLKYNSHMCTKILTILPEKNSVLKFKHYERQQKINFVIYADFESLLINCNKSHSSHTQNLNMHQPSCFAYYICCSHDTRLNKYVTYRGVDCVEKFVKLLVKDVKRIHNILLNKKSMTKLTRDQEKQYQNASNCHICNQLLFSDKVRDHDHITSEYRGAAHNHCNLIYRVCSFIPVIFHNLSGYDSHLFIEQLAKTKGAFKLIPKTKEKYITFSKVIESERGVRPIEIKFIDSFQFLNSSLDDLSNSLIEKDFVNLMREFGDVKKCELLRKKGIYPYDYMSSWSQYNETQLPSKNSFFNSLKMEHVSDDQYARAQKIWNVFNINTLGQYTDLYLKCDVLLLCDIFEKFRDTSLLYYKLDPAYYVSSPSLSWDAMLLYTNVKLELINDLQMYQMIEKGIRGGLAQCSLRHAKANNKYLPDFDESKPSSYLIYLDCNNLYGYAMTKKLPISDFEFLSEKNILEFDVTKIPDDCDYGFILEVDLLYPDYLHNEHKDLPFAAEKFKPVDGKTEKLIANLYDKFNYVIHYAHLKTCLKKGLILKKIHRVLKFRQEDFLKNYINLNTFLRQQSKTTFEKDFFKLLNNAVFGKTIENKRKQVNVKLVTQWRDKRNHTNKYLEAEKLVAKPNLKSITIFSENFVAIQLNHDKIILDRPIYIGFTVLEYAKLHLYNFHYDFIKSKYDTKAQLCYTDTDSLLYNIYTEDVYKDIRDNIDHFDTSNFKTQNIYNIPQVNTKVPGLFKDEMGGEPIVEFTGLRAKLYCIITANNQIKKAKGISKPVTKTLTCSNYNEALFNNNILRCKMNIIRSIKHVLYSQQVEKQVLNRNDDKLQILSDQIQTLPWGHCDTIF